MVRSHWNKCRQLAAAAENSWGTRASHRHAAPWREAPSDRTPADIAHGQSSHCPAPAGVPRAAELECGAIIVNWNSGSDLAECVDNLRSGVGGRVDEIVVVDNGSTDDSLARLGRPPGVTVVEAGRNLGFAAGVNLGARRCQSRLLLLLNPDVRPLHGAITAATRYLDSHPEVGIVGAVLSDGEGHWQPSAGRLHVLGHLLLDTRLVRRPVRRTRYVDWIHGAFLLMPRSLFEALGGLDERFFMYGEDMDLCARARAAGYRTAIDVNAQAVHYGNRSGAIRFGERRDAEVIKGEMRFYAGAGRRWPLVAFRVVGGVKYAIKAMLYVVGGNRAGARRSWLLARTCATFAPCQEHARSSG